MQTSSFQVSKYHRSEISTAISTRGLRDGRRMVGWNGLLIVGSKGLRMVGSKVCIVIFYCTTLMRSQEADVQCNNVLQSWGPEKTGEIAWRDRW